MARAAAPATFPLFSSLAPELRDQIWRGALPNKRAPHEEDYDPNNNELNMIFEFHHSLLDNIQFSVPLFFVNREARNITLTWIRKHGFKIRYNRQHRPLFVSPNPFDPMRDVLYIALDNWDHFLSASYDRLFQPDLEDQNLEIVTPLSRIAVPEALLRNKDTVYMLPELFRYFFNIRVLFIVIDTQPSVDNNNDMGVQPSVDNYNDIGAQPQWDFESTQGGAFVWNQNHRCFDFKDRRYNGNEALYKAIEEANNVLGEAIIREVIPSFEVRPIFATRR
ncbi:hypothetical protein OIDMADRAFT_106789 [Oidiodendron maius Zn]|uniref:2EXR domain-containing protein n=1 Tax=Oidiodendron maius (strain Zn) TaxID=913774 RepID=A0A0C3C6C8_OIDMZ|nr:hypothetical protein OIDMADRAFT_106789 [Oidiodendron maius Zn]